MSEIRISKLSEYVFYAGEYMKEKFELEVLFLYSEE